MPMIGASGDPLSFEREYWRQHLTVAGVDEVGRGALAGPVMVGTVVLGGGQTVLEGLDDSKRLSPRRRELLVPAIRAWSDDAAVGAASAREIDAYGLSIALRLAAWRAVSQLRRRPDHLLVDGPFDFVNSSYEVAELTGESDPYGGVRVATTTIVGGDAVSAAIAAASVLAKVERDGYMNELSVRYRDYEWERNKGYGSPRHLAALEEFGSCEEHRRSWRLPQKKSH